MMARVSRIHGGTLEGTLAEPYKGALWHGKFITIRDGVIGWRDGEKVLPDVTLMRVAESTLVLDGSLIVTSYVSALNIPIDLIRTTDHAAINNSDILVTDDVMTCTLTEGSWEVQGNILYVGHSQADIKINFGFTGTADFYGGGSALSANAAQETSFVDVSARYINTNYTCGCITGTTLNYSYRGLVVVTVPGVFAIKYAQANTNASDLIIKTGSYLSYRKTKTS